MNDRERLARVEEIFHAAVEFQGAARAEYVRRECGGDGELQRRVESLLEADTGTLPVERPVGLELPVQSFGRYRLISKLGDGGMGAVYLARDTDLNRNVALKTLLPAFALDVERKRRFLREARAASALNHPNIVSIYDFGHESDIDFYVMEYVPGKTFHHEYDTVHMRLASIEQMSHLKRKPFTLWRNRTALGQLGQRRDSFFQSLKPLQARFCSLLSYQPVQNGHDVALCFFGNLNAESHASRVSRPGPRRRAGCSPPLRLHNPGESLIPTLRSPGALLSEIQRERHRARRRGPARGVARTLRAGPCVRAGWV